MRNALLFALATATLTSGVVAPASAGASLIADASASGKAVTLGTPHLDVSDALSHLRSPVAREPKVPDASAKSVAQPVAKPTIKRAPTKVLPVVPVIPVAPSVPVAPTVGAFVGGSGVPAVGSSAFADLVLARIRFDWRSLPFTITFQGPRAGYLGLTTLGLPAAPHNHIDIFVRPGDSIERTAIVTAYEIAHVIDNVRNTDLDRKLWLTLRGNPGASWFTCNGCTEDQVGAGDFSDVFAWWAVGHSFFVSQVAPPPTPLQLVSLTPFFLV